MNPLVVLLMALGATAAADVEHEWRRREQLDALRRRLGMWAAYPRLPGAIANRLQWIERQFGLRAAILAQQAAVVMGEPSWGHSYRREDDRLIAKLLPWLAWRLTRGDAPDLVRVLEHPQHAPMRLDASGQPTSEHATYDRDQAWTDLHRLLDWFEGARPDLFQYTWDQAQAAEQEWFANHLPTFENDDWIIVPGDLVWRHSTDDGDWTVQRSKSVDDTQAAVAFLTGRIPSGSEYAYSDQYILKQPDGEPVAVVVEGRRGSLMEILFPEFEHSGYEPPDDDEAMQLLATFLRTEWAESHWPGYLGMMLAVGTVDEEGMRELLLEQPSMFSDEHGIGRHVAENITEWFSYDLLTWWANLANAEPSHFDDLFPNVAENQTPSKALITWMETGKWDYDLASEPLSDPEEVLPPVLHRYTIGYNDPDTDLGELEYGQVLPYELTVWEVWRHPNGPELEVKVQVYVLYQGDGTWAWSVWANQEAQLRLDPADRSTWQTSDGFDTFKLQPIIREQWGSKRLDDQAINAVTSYRGPFDEVDTTHSLDEALKGAWQAFIDTVDRAGLDEDEVRRFFGSDVPIEPPEGVEVEDYLEAFDLLQT